jgi:RND family efflux transporter MFP subunit
MANDEKQEFSFEQETGPAANGTSAPGTRLFKAPIPLSKPPGSVPPQSLSGLSLSGLSGAPETAGLQRAPGGPPAAAGSLPNQQKRQFTPLPPTTTTMTMTMNERETSASFVQQQALERVPTQVMEAVRSRVSAPAGRATKGNWKRQRRTLATILGVVVLLAITGFAAWHFVLRPLPSVTLYRVGMQTVNEDIGGGGLVYPVQRLDILYPFESHVLAVFVKPGDKVTANQSLIQLDLSEANAPDLAQLQVQVAEAKREMLAAQQYLASVSASGNAIVIAHAQQEYSAAQARYNALVAEASAPALHQGNLLSPISGTVTAVNVYPGQMFSANKVMLTIFDESSVIVRVQVPLINYDQVHPNQPALVTPSALPDASFNGTVMSVIQNVDPQTNTFEVWVKVNNTSGNLLPGMSAFVQIQQGVQSLVVPRLAVLNPDREAIVFVERGQHVYVQHVKVTGYSGDSVLIGSGLAPNDLIVLVGLNSLQDGQEVKVTGIENAAN